MTRLECLCLSLSQAVRGLLRSAGLTPALAAAHMARRRTDAPGSRSITPARRRADAPGSRNITPSAHTARQPPAAGGDAAAVVDALGSRTSSIPPRPAAEAGEAVAALQVLCTRAVQGAQPAGIARAGGPDTTGRGGFTAIARGAQGGGMRRAWERMAGKVQVDVSCLLRGGGGVPVDMEQVMAALAALAAAADRL